MDMDAFDLAAGLIEQRDGLARALELLKRKDDIIRAAYAAGVTKADLHRLTGMARTTIDRIIAEDS